MNCYKLIVVGHLERCHHRSGYCGQAVKGVGYSGCAQVAGQHYCAVLYKVSLTFGASERLSPHFSSKLIVLTILQAVYPI